MSWAVWAISTERRFSKIFKTRDYSIVYELAYGHTASVPTPPWDCGKKHSMLRAKVVDELVLVLVCLIKEMHRNASKS